MQSGRSRMRAILSGGLAGAFAAAALVGSALAQTPAAPSIPPPSVQTPASPAPAQSSPAPVAPAGPQAEGATPQIVVAARPAAIVSGQSNWGDGYPALLTAFAKLARALESAGIKPAGKPLAVLLSTSDEGFTFDAMVPLAQAPPAGTTLGEGLRLGATPEGTAYKFQHRGAYDDLDTTYEAITAFLDDKGIEAKDVIIEEYLTTPKDADDTTLEVDIYVFPK